MRYWITTHWAPEEDDESTTPRGVWVPDGREKAGANLRSGDAVLIYQAASGPAVLREGEDGADERIGRRIGKGGIVLVAQACDKLRPNGAEEPTRYVGRRPIWWRWHADTAPVSRNGFVSVDELKKILAYSPGYRMRGFGDYNSGLKEISEAQYTELVRIFRSRARKTFSGLDTSAPRRRHVTGVPGGESDAHKFLKLYVAANPSRALGERGLKTLEVEFPFDSNDRADLVLEDHAGRIIGLEVEVAVDPSDVSGILQAIKYRHMLAFVHERRFEETRSFLVAYSITKKLQEICRIYCVECFCVSKDDVLNWKRQQEPSPPGETR